MDYVRRANIEFVFPDFFSNECLTKEVKNRDTSEVKVPDGAIGFRFFDVLVAKVECDGKTVELRSGHLDQSPMYYYGGRILTRAEVVREIPNNRTLLSNMDGSGWNRVIMTRAGNFQPFKESDVFIKATA